MLDEVSILSQAESILRKRLERLGESSDPSAAGNFLRMRVGALDQEEFHVLLLDACHRIIAIEPMFRGIVDGAEVHPREVVRTALRHNAAAMILSHNHPSGDPTPGAADRAVTERLK